MRTSRLYCYIPLRESAPYGRDMKKLPLVSLNFLNSERNGFLTENNFVEKVMMTRFK